MNLIFLLLTLLMQPPAPRTFYVASTGFDGDDGRSPKTAWRTLKRASEHRFQPGDRLLLRSGDTFYGMLTLTADDEGTPDRPVTISSFGPGRAIIEARDTSAILVQDMGGIAIGHLTLRSPDRRANRSHGLQIVNTRPNADQRRYVRVDSVTVSGFGGDGLWLGGNPDDKSQSGFTDVQITRCTFFDNQYHGLFITGIWDTNAKGYANHNVVIRHCLAYENTGDPDYLENHSGSGMEIDNVQDARIDSCAAYRNGYLCNAKIGGPCGIWLHAADRAVISRCVAIGNRTGRGLDGAGFDLDGGTTNCRIEYCYARDNDGAGILVWNYDKAPHRLGDNEICFNILENNGKTNRYGEIHIGTAGAPIERLRVYNNTILTSRQPTGQQHCIWVEGRPTNGELRFWNNLFITQGGVAPVLVSPAQPNVAFEGNIYWSPDGSASPDQARPGGVWLDPKLSAYNTAESPRPGVARPGVARPDVARPAPFATLRGYHPLPGSPLLGRGIDLSGKGLKNVTPGRLVGALGK